MDHRERVEHEIDAAAVDLVTKVHVLEERVEGTKNRVVQRAKNAIDIRHHVREHPWRMMGIAVAFGFSVGYLTGR